MSLKHVPCLAPVSYLGTESLSDPAIIFLHGIFSVRKAKLLNYSVLGLLDEAGLPNSFCAFDCGQCLPLAHAIVLSRSVSLSK